MFSMGFLGVQRIFWWILVEVLKDSSLQLWGISNTQKHTDTHTHILKKIYIYIHTRTHTHSITWKLPTKLVPNLKGSEEIPATLDCAVPRWSFGSPLLHVPRCSRQSIEAKKRWGGNPGNQILLSMDTWMPKKWWALEKYLAILGI